LAWASTQLVMYEFIISALLLEHNNQRTRRSRNDNALMPRP
jgi:hypothetical protein